jgi:hypothetical protein
VPVLVIAVRMRVVVFVVGALLAERQMQMWPVVIGRLGDARPGVGMREHGSAQEQGENQQEG